MFKRIALLVMACAALAAIACAQNLPTEEDYKDLDQLRSRLVRMRREMDKFMRELMESCPAGEGVSAAGFGEDVRVDVSELDKYVIVKADLPGMDKDRIEVVLTNNRILKIGGSRETEKRETTPGMVRQERMLGRFERALELPVECMSEGIKAGYKNGVLEVTIPKKEQAKESRVKISVQ